MLTVYQVWDVDPPVPFPPSIEPKDVEDAFMTADPWTIPTFVPWLTGILSEDGAFRTSSKFYLIIFSLIHCCILFIKIYTIYTSSVLVLDIVTSVNKFYLDVFKLTTLM